MSKIRISEEFAPSSTDFIRVATLEELKATGMIVVRGARCPILVVYDDAKVFALDNRCPHLGFPLHRGSVEDGILTCHWHHARFDLASGCTFDLWADDVPTAAVELRDGVVWVCPQTRYGDGHARWRNRLREGLEQNIGLVLAKAVLGLIGEGVDYRALVRDAVLFGGSEPRWLEHRTHHSHCTCQAHSLLTRGRDLSRAVQGDKPGSEGLRWCGSAA